MIVSNKVDIQILENRVEEVNSAGFQNIEELKTLRKKNADLDKENMALKVKSEAYENVLSNGIETVDLYTQIENLRQFIYCPLCKLKFKSHVIDSCMHCFCEDCLLGRLKARNRTCPKCQQEYNKDSIKKVYL